MCAVLPIAPSTYYAAKSRPPSARALRDESSETEITRVYAGQLLRLRPPQGVAAAAAGGHSGGPLHRGAPHARAGPERRGPRQDLEDDLPRSLALPGRPISWIASSPSPLPTGSGWRI